MSINKIAEMAGVSPSTVSRVLNNPNYHCSSEETRERIWKAAMELNYTPNEAARSLKLGRKLQEENKTYYINVLMTRMDESRTDPFFSELLRIIESEIHKHFCILSKVWYMPVFSDDRKCNNINIDSIIGSMYKETNGKCDGLVIVGKCNSTALKKLDAKYKSVVSVNRNSTNYEIDEILCDGHKVASIAVNYLISLGHKEIGYVGDCQNEARYQGFTNALKENGIVLNSGYVVETKQTEAEGFEAMEKMLRSGCCPTGIYCANDITAIGMLKALNKYKNLQVVPSIIASDDIEEAGNCHPMLTTVKLPKEEMGKFALYLLVDRIKNGHSSVVRMELEGRLVIRDSCQKMSAGNSKGM